MVHFENLLLTERLHRLYNPWQRHHHNRQQFCMDMVHGHILPFFIIINLYLVDVNCKKKERNENDIILVIKLNYSSLIDRNKQAIIQHHY